ncbi:MAG: hypothetical protein O9972_06475 [Burkholderiales bacterium]|jgi:hypothetical protein|nr:hypothetical protein [Burkholderiales bacterium]MCZ8097544.1 hypothetical protein [Burkholderiales bacterium]
MIERRAEHRQRCLGALCRLACAFKVVRLQPGPSDVEVGDGSGHGLAEVVAHGGDESRLLAVRFFRGCLALAGFEPSRFGPAALMEKLTLA